MILLGGVGAIVVVFLAMTLLGGGDDGDDSSTATTRRRSTTSTTRAGATTSTTAPGTPETFEVFNGKNPFLPLRGAPRATTGGTTTGGTTGGTTSGGTTSGGTTSGGTTSGGTTATTVASGGGTGSGGSGEPSRGQRVSLLDVFTEGGAVVANVKVNDTVYKVRAGQTFATSFQAVSLSQAESCGRFLFGDDQFRLCEGEQTVK